MGVKLIDHGYRYILTVIDCLSRRAWAIPLKNKTKAIVGRCFREIFKKEKLQPRVIWTDRGREFNADEIGIPVRFAYGVPKVGIIERLNKTLKNWMWFELTANDSEEWLSVLPAIVTRYNTSVHSSIGITPNAAWEAGPGSKVEKILLQKQHLASLKNKYKQDKTTGEIEVEHPKDVAKLKVGDRVRIVNDPPKSGDMFKKGYKPQWSTEIYIVKSVLENFDGPPMYALEGKIRHFYGAELQKSVF